MARLDQLPTDILLYIISLCELVDVATFATVCRALREISSTHRSLWIGALENARRVDPIACTFNEDLTAHDIPTLKTIALHTLRLRRNWARREPRIIGPIKAFTLGLQLLDVIFQVPGSELYLFHSRTRGTVEAWDIGSARQVAPPVYVAKKILDVSPGQDLPGKFSMGLLTSETPENDNNKLIIVCLEYGKNGVSIKLAIQHTFEAEMYHWAVFMSPEVVGVLRCNPGIMLEDETIDIIALNISTGRRAYIKTDIARDDFPFEGQSGTTMVDGCLSIVTEFGDDSTVYTCLKKHLPHDGNPNCPERVTLKCPPLRGGKTPPRPDEGTFVPEGVLSADSFYGVPAVSLQLINEELDRGVTRQSIEIIFWTSVKRDTQTEDEMTAAGRPCFRVEPHDPVAIPGCLQDSSDSSWQLMLLPHSGRKVLLVINNNENQPILYLVNFDHDTNTPSLHVINLPSFIDLSLVHGLSLDDHRGVITLLDTRGSLFAIPFA
ncbi:hypothetical protein NLJ89_g2638 [Agrocybe chaxingu]|uniref:F-box domain-containing protein n=1 Tax=Agrocybe chaxingu TaxID=84603 RepID=A0A9W8MYM7_9AGAR|nr:hypothetical protein NLJ89_g2638 [Agrocybe chaxingu]